MSAREFPIAGNLVPQATFMIAKRITPTKTMPAAQQRNRVYMLLLVVFAVAVFAGVVVSTFGAIPAAAQESALDKGPAPPYAEPAAPSTQPEPTYDPLRADKSLEVGTFYFKRGKYDAAIERFQDATRFQPKLARSYSLLGEAYEKKGETDNALAAYKKYLEIYRTAPDREKILKRIEKLESQSHAQGKLKSG